MWDSDFDDEDLDEGIFLIGHRAPQATSDDWHYLGVFLISMFSVFCGGIAIITAIALFRLITTLK